MKIPECLVLQLKELQNSPIRDKWVSYSVKSCKALIRYYKCLNKNRNRSHNHYNDYVKYNNLAFRNII